MSIQGNYVRTLVLRDDGGNRGLAISPDGSRMVVSNQNTHKIAVYSLPDGAFLAEFGDGRSSEPGKFNAPQKVCFSPRNSGNILISDLGNKCVKVLV